MRAVILNGHGGVEVMEVTEVPEPDAGPEEVVVDVTATALNRADMLQRMGGYPDPSLRTGPEIPGLEYAGTVSAVGSRVRSVAVGDPVMGIVAGSAYAERVVTHERMTLPVPASVPLTDAAALPEVFLTAFDALVVQGGLSAGRRALVHAGASGVGTAAIQIAGAIGARIAVTCSAGKVDACRDLGADLVIDYGATDFADAVREWTGGGGVDVVLDVIGGEYLDRNIDCLAVQGRIIQVGVMGEGMATFPLGKLLPKRASLIGTVLRSRPIEQKIAVNQRFAAEMLPLIAAGRLRPVIDSRYPLDQIREAHTHMAANANIGKILIDV